MPKGLVLVIEDDEWVARLLATAIRDAGFEVVLTQTAKEGFEKLASSEPDCIVCDVELPDSDGYAVARHVRTQPSRIAITPFLFLSPFDDQQSRLHGFHVGADVYMTKPFRIDEVVAQVGALVQMAARLREQHSSYLSIPSPESSAIEGDLSQMSIATVLTVLEMERRTGTFEVVSKKRKARLEIASGYAIDGAVGGTKTSALEVLRTMLGWNVGRFSFTPLPHRDPPLGQRTIGAFLIEAVRLDDEMSRTDIEPTAAKRDAPSIGGPPIQDDDWAPPSARASATGGQAAGAGAVAVRPSSDSKSAGAVALPPPPTEATPGPPVVAPPQQRTAASSPSLRTGLKLPPLPSRPAGPPPAPAFPLPSAGTTPGAEPKPQRPGSIAGSEASPKPPPLPSGPSQAKPASPPRPPRPQSSPDDPSKKR